MGMTVLDATRALMRDLGLTTVFGNPGTTEVPFLADWPDDLRYVLGLQESVVVAMADGWAQARGEAVLVNLHSAGGVGHGLGSVFTAFRNRTPMVVVAGQQARPLLEGEPFLGATDAPTFPAPYVKWSHEPASPAAVPAALARAWLRATQPPRGPTFLSVPVDDWEAPADGPVTAPAPVAGFAPDAAAVAAVAAALDDARRPAFVVGPAVDMDGAVEDMVALAERLRAPVWAAPLSHRCSFPEDHPCFAGFLPPERIALAAELAAYDLVVVLGAPAFTYHVTREGTAPPWPPLVVVSDDEDVLARAEASHRVLGGVGATVEALLDTVAAAGGERALPGQHSRAPVPEAGSGAPISPAAALHVLADVLPADALVVEEVPSHRNLLHQHLPIRARGGGFLTAASGALGYAIAAAVGAALARPDRRTVGLVGDGAAMYGIQALWTAAREQAPVTFVVLDNGGYAAVEVLGRAAGGSVLPGVALGGIDLAGLARSMGCPATSVERPEELAPALAASLAEPGPHLVHVTVDADSGPMY